LERQKQYDPQQAYADTTDAEEAMKTPHEGKDFIDPSDLDVRLNQNTPDTAVSNGGGGVDSNVATPFSLGRKV
jgi:hypothetical protein